MTFSRSFTRRVASTSIWTYAWGTWRARVIWLAMPRRIWVIGTRTSSAPSGKATCWPLIPRAGGGGWGWSGAGAGAVGAARGPSGRAGAVGAGAGAGAGAADVAAPFDPVAVAATGLVPCCWT